MNGKQLEQIGRWAFGDSWKAQLGRELGIDRRRISVWAANRELVPTWMNRELTVLLDRRAAEIKVAQDFLSRINGGEA